MKKYLLIFLAVISVNHVSAQSITGKVVDGKSRPVPYASCILRSMPDSAYVSGVVSNEDGRFEIPVKQGRYVIQFSYLGYKTIEKECSNGDLGTITLEENTTVLQEVAVEGERPLVRMENNRLTYNVGAILEKKIVSDVHELLKDLPSVMSLDGNSISLVGASSTTICISGKVSQLDASQILDLLKSLPAEEVEKVEVIYNAPPQWHVQGAVINVVMKKKKTYTLNGQIQGGWTNQHENSFNIGGTVITSTPKWDLDVMYKFANLRNINETTKL